jgi:hypothetical protein
MESKHAATLPTATDRPLAPDRGKPRAPRAILSNAAKPSTVHARAAAPRIITTSPAIKPRPMAIALEADEDDLRPTNEMLTPVPARPRPAVAAPAASAASSPEPAVLPKRNADSASDADAAACEEHSDAPHPEHTVASLATSSSTSARVAVDSPSARTTARIGLSFRLGTSVVFSAACVTATAIVVYHLHRSGDVHRRGLEAAHAAAPARVSAAPLAVASTPTPAEPPTEFAAAIALPSTTTPAPVTQPASSTARARPAQLRTEVGSDHRASASTVHAARFATGRAFDSSCVRGCHGNADCTLRCMSTAATRERASHGDLSSEGSLRDTPTPEAVRLALARLGGEVSQCSNGALTGIATVDVTFAHTGRVTTAVVRHPFSGSAIGSCIATVVRSARLPPFDSAPLHVVYSFHVH